MATNIIRGVMDSVSHLPRSAARDRLRSRRAAAPPGGPAPLSDRRPIGRAWINGREVGGTAVRLAHLVAGHD
jgi:hypothetical protein